MHKIYQNGRQFVAENLEIIRAYPVETCFFELDSCFDAVDTDTYAVKVWAEDRYLLALRLKPFPLMLFGNEQLCGELASVIVQNGYTFASVLTFPQLGETFLREYEKLCGGRHQIKHAMEIMFGQNIQPCDTTSVRWASIADAPIIARFAVDFAAESLGENYIYEEHLQRVEAEIGSYAVLEQNGQVVSAALRTREMTALCAVSYVYTLPQYRNKGYARKVVSFITQSIIADGKMPYLFVDKANPVSNHLYQKIGYRYAMPQYEIEYKK